jgi:tRNA G10  N-methylase Trm11
VTWQLLPGDMRSILPTLPENHFHSVVCDPPYDLLQGSRNGSRRINADPASSPFSRHDERVNNAMLRRA